MNLLCSRWDLLRYLSWRFGCLPRESRPPLRELTRPDVAQQECPCRKKAWQCEGENKPHFSISRLQAEANNSDLLSRLWVWLTWKLWLAHCHPAMSCGAADGRSSWQRPELPCSSQLSLRAVFFPHGCSPHAGVELGEAEVLFLSVSISQREHRDDRCVSSPLASSIQGTQSVIHQDVLLYLLSQLRHTHIQLWLQTAVKHRQLFHSHRSMHNYTMF